MTQIKTKTVVSIFSLILLAKVALAASLPIAAVSRDIRNFCPDQLLGFENIQLQQSLSGDGKRCYLSLHPRNAFETLIYRDYLLTDDGYIMVFNSFSAEKIQTPSDGAREFYFLPSEFKGFQWKVEDSYLVVTGLANKTLKFSLKTAQLDQVSGAVIKVAEKVLPNNNGGWEIISADFVYVDAGFKFGDSPSNEKGRSSEVKNPIGQVCKLKNTKTYNYLEDSAYLKPFQELKKNINLACPKFKI